MSKKQNNVSSKSKKLIKQLIRESKPEPFVIDGKVVYFNPLKKLLEGDKCGDKAEFTFKNEYGNFDIHANTKNG